MFKSSIRSKVLASLEPRIKEAEESYESDKKIAQHQFEEGLEALQNNLTRQKDEAFERRVSEALGFSTSVKSAKLAPSTVGSEVQ